MRRDPVRSHLCWKLFFAGIILVDCIIFRVHMFLYCIALDISSTQPKINTLLLLLQRSTSTACGFFLKHQFFCTWQWLKRRFFLSGHNVRFTAETLFSLLSVFNKLITVLTTVEYVEKTIRAPMGSISLKNWTSRTYNLPKQSFIMLRHQFQGVHWRARTPIKN